MKKNSFIRNNLGFTVVELLAVVIIISLLVASIAPLYEKYMLKARMTEGPIALTQVYLAEREVFAEYGTYVACMFALGIQPEKRGYFVTGFMPKINQGKASWLVPNCVAQVAQAPRVCVGAIFREQECNLNTSADNSLKYSDYSLIPRTLLKRNSALPYTNNGTSCTASRLTDDTGSNEWEGSATSNPSFPRGWDRKVNRFTACTLAALASGANTHPTEFTIDEQKKIIMVNQGD